MYDFQHRYLAEMQQMAIPLREYFAEVLLGRNGKIVEPYDNSCMFCTSDRWYNPDCVPAIVKDFPYSLIFKHNDRHQSRVTILYGNGQYINLDNMDEVLPSDPEFKAVDRHFVVNNLDSVEEHPLVTSKQENRTSYGQTKSRIGYGGSGKNGREYQDPQKSNFRKNIFKHLFCDGIRDYNKSQSRTVPVWS